MINIFHKTITIKSMILTLIQVMTFILMQPYFTLQASRSEIQMWPVLAKDF
jgi:hypothetical protein